MVIGDKARYVITSVLVSILSLARNLIFLKIFGLADLGQIALMQTIVMLIGLTQGGMINGGYRIYAIGDLHRKEIINNTLFTFLAGMLLVAILIGGIAHLGLDVKTVHPTTLYISLASGIATLASTWINNALIGDGNLRQSNLINGVAVAASCLVGALAWQYGLLAALISMLIQPVVAITAGMYLAPHLRPTRLHFKIETIKSILNYGFIPFAAGIFALLNQQLDRWSITYYLGSEQLGRFYIVILYASIFTLVPISLLNLHFPRAIKAYSENRASNFREILKKHFRDLSLYLFGACLMTIVALPWALGNFFPKYEQDARLIYYAMPALVITVLCDPASMALDSVKRLKPLLVAGLLALVSSILLVSLAQQRGLFSVEAGIAIRGISAALACTYLSLVLRVVYRDILRAPVHANHP